MHKVALIGAGYWGPNIAKNLTASDKYKLVGICDIDKEKIDKMKKIYGSEVSYYTDYKQVLEDPDIKVCAVALRDDVGQKIAREVLKAGKHLFMEKPMATNLDDASVLKQLAIENGVLIHVDHLLVFNPVIREIKKLIDSGELGDVIFFESNRANLGPHIKKDMNAMWDLAVHDLAILDYLCDMEEALDVNCVGEKRFGEQEILTYLTVKYRTLTAMIKSSWFSPLKERRIMVCGTKKMVVFNDLSDSEKLTIYDKSVDIDLDSVSEYGKLEARVRSGDIYIPNIEREDALLNSLNHFAECIDNNRASLTNEDQAIRILNILSKADDDLERMQTDEG